MAITARITGIFNPLLRLHLMWELGSSDSGDAVQLVDRIDTFASRLAPTIMIRQTSFM